MKMIIEYEEKRGVLDTQKLIQQARNEAGLDDLGNQDFVASLDKMLDCISHDTNYNLAGLNDFKAEVVRNLVNRLRFQDDLKKHPEILKEDVSDPIIIIGLPRSGTTKTQRMMGTDPNLFKTYMWQLINPAPFPNSSGVSPDPRIAAAATGGTCADEDAGVQAAHHMAAEQVDEDWTLFEFTFNEWFQCNRNPSMSWHEWLKTRTSPSDLENYQYVQSLFKYLQWQQGGRNGRRWLTKNCAHLGYINELLAVHPNATLVHIHRDPYSCVPSLAKLLQFVWGLRVDDVDPMVLGKLIIDWEKFHMQRYLQARENSAVNDRIFDVQYEQIRNDPMPVIKEIYARAGHEFTAEAEQSMLQWEKSNEQGKHGKHEYSLAEFGLSEAIIDDALGDYMQRFIH